MAVGGGVRVGPSFFWGRFSLERGFGSELWFASKGLNRYGPSSFPSQAILLMFAKPRQKIQPNSTLQNFGIKIWCFAWSRFARIVPKKLIVPTFRNVSQRRVSRQWPHAPAKSETRFARIGHGTVHNTVLGCSLTIARYTLAAAKFAQTLSTGATQLASQSQAAGMLSPEPLPRGFADPLLVSDWPHC